MRIPLFNLARAEQLISEDLDRRWRALRQNTAFVGGPEVEQFEGSWADYLGEGSQCVAVANGTDAIELALRALEVRSGDEVLVPAYTFVATASAVALAGATPVMVDVEAETLNIDFDCAESLVGERTVGVIGVHLYGNPCDLDRATSFANKHGLWLVEDAAQAHGARWCGEGAEWRKVGSFGHLTTWSFYPSKNLGCFGDGGAVTGRDSELIDRVRKLANHGRIEHYWHGMVGRNSRLDAVQAAVLNCRLPHLDQNNERRRQVASRYLQAAESLSSVSTLAVDDRAEPVFHQFTVRVEGRDQVQQQLADRGIGTAVHYPAPLHTQPLWRGRSEVVRGGYPEAEVAAQEVLCLPMFPELTDAEVDEVIDALSNIFS